MPLGGAWPMACCKCGADGGGAALRDRRHRLSFTPPWTFAVLALSPLIGALCMALARRRAPYSIPICASCDRAYDAARRATWLSALPGLALLLLAPVAWAQGGSGWGAPSVLAALAVLFVVPSVVARVVLRPRFVRATKIDDVAAWVGGVHPAVRVQASAASLATLASCTEGALENGWRSP